jgi:p-methyltransferase
VTARADLDCVVVGYHDMDFRAVAARARAARQHSGAWENLLTNSVPVGDRRLTYMDLLNRTLEQVTGRDPRLHVGTLPNLGVCYLKSFLRRRGFAVEAVNFFTHEQARLLDLLSARPRVVAITTTFYVEPQPITEIVEFIRSHQPEARIVVGGPHIFNACTDHDPSTQDFLFDAMGADFYVFDSQGESTLAGLLSALGEGAGARLDAVPNLIYRSADGRFRRTARVPESNDLDQNSIDWRHFDRTDYVPTVQMRTARSCAFACAFCRYPVVAGALTLASLPVIEAELRHLHDAGVENVVFVDDTFNVPLPRFKQICRMMIANRFRFRWFSYFRCSNADDATYELMRESGCQGVFLGIESGDQAILERMNKFAAVARYEEGVRKLNACGITTFASLIIGFPGETEDSVKRTIDFIERTEPTFYRAELYYHDTKVPIHEQAGTWKLAGAGYSWKHATMDWRTAARMVEEIYRTVRGSTVLPLYMFDFWSLPYLVGKGIPLEQVTRFAAAAQKMLLAGLDESAPDPAPFERELQSVFRPSCP